VIRLDLSADQIADLAVLVSARNWDVTRWSFHGVDESYASTITLQVRLGQHSPGGHIDLWWDAERQSQNTHRPGQWMISRMTEDKL